MTDPLSHVKFGPNREFVYMLPVLQQLGDAYGFQLLVFVLIPVKC